MNGSLLNAHAQQSLGQLSLSLPHGFNFPLAPKGTACRSESDHGNLQNIRASGQPSWGKADGQCLSLWRVTCSVFVCTYDGPATILQIMGD